MILSNEQITKIFCAYTQKYGLLDNFNISQIHFVDDLQAFAKSYEINESTENMSGYTIPYNNYDIVIKDSLPGFDSIVALTHELTHVRDFIYFSKKYNSNDIYKHPLFQSLQMYSEINAFKISYEFTFEYLSQNRNPDIINEMFDSQPLEDVIEGFLCKKEIYLYDIFQSIGYILLYDEHYQTQDHLSHLPQSLSPRLTHCIEMILDAHSHQDIEAIDDIIYLLSS